MEIEFVKVSPTQNMTILVTSPLDRAQYRDLAEKIMAYDNVHAEQVGFVEKARPPALARLQMAGGEFCANASLSLCAYLVWKNIAENNEENTADGILVPIEVSGADEIIHCTIKKTNDGFLGKINMPLPEMIMDFNTEISGKKYSFPVVYMPGISHVIIDIASITVKEEIIVEALISNMNAITKEDAIGLMFFDKKQSYIKPFVYVKTAGTEVWERGCGSGTAAMGAYLAHVSGKHIIADIAQPGGIIKVEADIKDGEKSNFKKINNITKISNLTIEGKIQIVAQGKAFLP